MLRNGEIVKRTENSAKYVALKKTDKDRKKKERIDGHFKKILN
jgi:hypothetical protein